MKSIRQGKWWVEGLWWIFTLLLICLVMTPIWRHVPAFPFQLENILLIIFFITFSRYIFLLPISLIARTKWIKLTIIGLAVLFLFVTTHSIFEFRNFMDEEGLQTIVDHLHVADQTRLMRYIKQEMVFFGVGSVITGILLPIRMIVSLYRMRNSNRV